MTATATNTAICRCTLCNGEIEFAATRSGEIIPCPWCAHETELYIPGGLVRAEPLDQPTPKRDVTQNGEPIIYQEPGVLITPARLVVGTETFAMRNVTSVRSEKITPKRFWSLFGCFICTVIAVGAGESGASGWATFWGIGAALLLIKVIAARSEYRLVIATAAGENRSYTTRDQLQIGILLDAVNKAIAAR